MEVSSSSVFVRAVPPGASAPADPYDVLQAILNDCIAFSGKRAKIFGALYYSLRVALIVLSACAAAKGIAFLEHNAAWLSLFVAIGTTLDTWLQPGVRYKGHYTYNDKYRALKADLFFVKREDEARLTAMNEAWKSMDEEYRKTVLPI
jgi:hypothetical protein